MFRLSSTLVSTVCVLVISCGGNVVVDHQSQGAGGSAGAKSSGNTGGAPDAGMSRPTGVAGEVGKPACDAATAAPSDGVCFANIGTCNPVTGAPCAIEEGQTCDLGANGFACFTVQHAAALCQACDDDGGALCGPTLTCIGSHVCARYCCHDDDCGSGQCDKNVAALEAGGVGICTSL